MEERNGEVWDRIIEPKDNELSELARMVGDLKDRQHQIFINVNNHYEGSAPRTIERVKAKISV